VRVVEISLIFWAGIASSSGFVQLRDVALLAFSEVQPSYYQYSIIRGGFSIARKTINC